MNKTGEKESEILRAKIFEWTEMELRCIIQSYESIYM